MRILIIGLGLALAACQTAAQPSEVPNRFQNAERNNALLHEARAECERLGTPRVGMTSAQVLATCFREPTEVKRTTMASGTSEIWIYRLHGAYVFLTDGVVTAIHQ